jgi:hypothetical protein
MFYLFRRGAPKPFARLGSPRRIIGIMTEPANNARATGPALEAMYQVLLWLTPTVEKFPRKQKFVLGDRIESTALDVLELLIGATYTKSRDKMLTEANLGLERLLHARAGGIKVPSGAPKVSSGTAMMSGARKFRPPETEPALVH